MWTARFWWQKWDCVGSHWHLGLKCFHDRNKTVSQTTDVVDCTFWVVEMWLCQKPLTSWTGLFFFLVVEMWPYHKPLTSWMERFWWQKWGCITDYWLLGLNFLDGGNETFWMVEMRLYDTPLTSWTSVSDGRTEVASRNADWVRVSSADAEKWDSTVSQSVS